MKIFITTIFAVAAVSHAKIIDITVGKIGNYFDPFNLNAQAGDKLRFNFYGNNSVVQSNFAAPCTPLTNGFYSGFVPSGFDGPAEDAFVVTVNNTNPIWFYCSQADSCQTGMWGVVNAVDEERDIGTYAYNAENVKTNVTPKGGVRGGILGPVAASSKSSFTDPVTKSSFLATLSTATSTNNA